MYEQAITEHGTMIRRLGRGYEADPDRRRDLLQEIHLQLWRSLELFDGRCALRTWVYRVAHNVAASHIVRKRRIAARLVDLEALDMEPVPLDGEERADHRHAAQKLLGLIHHRRRSPDHLGVYRLTEMIAYTPPRSLRLPLGSEMSAQSCPPQAKPI